MHPSRRSFAVLLAAATLLLGPCPALGATPAAELRDVSSDHWAFQAIQALSERYGVMEGFPDKKFRGTRTVSRHELAAALAKLMAAVEKRIAIATGAPLPDPGISPEDLRTIARLQREFREELDALKERIDGLEGRVTGLEKRVKLGGAVRFDYRDWAVDPQGTLAGSPSGDFRVRQTLTLEAPMPDDLTFTGALNADLYSPSGTTDAFLRRNPATPAMDVYLSEALFRFNPGWSQGAAGLGALRQHLPLGATAPDPFRMALWTNGTGGFGFVGSPGVRLDGQGAVSLVPSAQGAPLWLAGTSPTAEWLDPANSALYAPHGSLLAAGQGTVGPLRLGAGVCRGPLSGPLLQGGAPHSAPSLPGFPAWGDGARAYFTAGLDAGPFRVNSVASGMAGALTDPTGRDKLVAASVDLGDEGLGLSGEVLARGSFAPDQLTVGQAALRVGTADLFGLGVGTHLGWLGGQAMPWGPGGWAARAAGAPRTDFDSVGLVVRTPALFVIPSISIAFQQTGFGGIGPTGALSSAALSGLTLQSELSLFNWPSLTASWSRGKFGTGAGQGLLDPAPFTHDQIAVSTGVRF